MIYRPRLKPCNSPTGGYNIIIIPVLLPLQRLTLLTPSHPDIYLLISIPQVRGTSLCIVVFAGQDLMVFPNNHQLGVVSGIGCSKAHIGLIFGVFFITGLPEVLGIWISIRVSHESLYYELISSMMSHPLGFSAYGNRGGCGWGMFCWMSSRCKG